MRCKYKVISTDESGLHTMKCSTCGHITKSAYSPHLVHTMCRKSVGLGDTVSKILTKLGFRKCGGCKKRQATLNRLVPYKIGDKDHAH